VAALISLIMCPVRPAEGLPTSFEAIRDGVVTRANLISQSPVVGGHENLQNGGVHNLPFMSVQAQVSVPNACISLSQRWCERYM
jgi:hypothetical protein